MHHPRRNPLGLRYDPGVLVFLRLRHRQHPSIQSLNPGRHEMPSVKGHDNMVPEVGRCGDHCVTESNIATGPFCDRSQMTGMQQNRVVDRYYPVRQLEEQKLMEDAQFTRPNAILGRLPQRKSTEAELQLMQAYRGDVAPIDVCLAPC